MVLITSSAGPQRWSEPLNIVDAMVINSSICLPLQTICLFNLTQFIWSSEWYVTFCYVYTVQQEIMYNYCQLLRAKGLLLEAAKNWLTFRQIWPKNKNECDELQQMQRLQDHSLWVQDYRIRARLIPMPMYNTHFLNENVFDSLFYVLYYLCLLCLCLQVMWHSWWCSSVVQQIWCWLAEVLCSASAMERASLMTLQLFVCTNRKA